MHCQQLRVEYKNLGLMVIVDSYKILLAVMVLIEGRWM